MLFDWFTVVAQLLNFLILVWLMKRFLYKPILDAIDAREQLIAKRLEEAETQRTEAESERETLRQKIDTFDGQRDELMQRAENEAKTERRRLFDAARQAADELRAERQEALVSEQQSLNEEITRRTRDEVFAIARKTLGDLAGTTLEEQMSAMFSRRLRELDRQTKEDFAAAMKTSSEPALVRSAFTLPSEQQAVIRTALKEIFGDEVQVRFAEAPEVISGIGLIMNGRKVAWSIDHYLLSLQESVDELLRESSAPQPKAEVATSSMSETGSASSEVEEVK